jgi:hypothetical protein
MEENIQEVKRPNCMLMPDEEDEKTEGYNEWKNLKENYVWKRYKENKGKLIFLWEELPSRK